MENIESLQTSFWVMIFIQTIGSIDMPGRGARKMPAPREYVAILVAWLVLQLISGINAGAARAAAMFGWILVLAGMVVGPFGQKATGFMQTIANNFGITPPTSPGVTQPNVNIAGATTTGPGGSLITGGITAAGG